MYLNTAGMLDHFLLRSPLILFTAATAERRIRAIMNKSRRVLCGEQSTENNEQTTARFLTQIWLDEVAGTKSEICMPIPSLPQKGEAR